MPGATFVFAKTLASKGVYSVRLDGDGKLVECTVNLSTDSPRSSAGQCDDTTAEWSGGSRSLGDTSSAQETFFEVIWWAGQPKKVSIEVYRDGIEVLSRTIEPVYEAEEINGPGCGTCPTARADLDG